MLNFSQYSPGFVSLLSMRVLLRAALALLGLFLPIFLFELFGLKIHLVVLYYLLHHIIYALTVAGGCQYLNRIGLRRSLRVSIVMGALYLLMFFFIDQFLKTGELDYGRIVFYLAGAVLFGTLHRIMYFMPMHTDMAKFTSRIHRGEQVSLVEAATMILEASMPLVAGWIVFTYNYDILFLLAIVIYLAGLIPLITLPRTKERFSWSYSETWQNFFSSENRQAILAYMADGAESVVGKIVWPIFIWQILNGDYLEVGIISSVIVAFTIVVQLLAGKAANHRSGKDKMLKWGSGLYALGWIFKIFIATAFHIFVVSAFHNFTKILTRTSFEALHYEKAADHGHYVDEYTVLHEIALHSGKSLMLVFVLILITFFSLEWTFLLAAVAAIIMTLILNEKKAA